MPLRDPRATSRRLLAGGLALALAAVASGALVELWRFGTSSATAASHAEQQVRRSFDRMDDEALGRVFEPYFSTKTTGTGLGLPIAKRNIELNGGQIEVDSGKGRGTTVIVRLPVAT